MSGIAQVLHNLGHRVSGSDIKDSELLGKLRNLGIKVNIGHRVENVTAEGIPDEVIISSAIQENNCELEAAVELGLRIRKRAEIISMLMNQKRGIAVAGTHGKTTTTAMVSLVLEDGGLDPTIMLGGILSSIGGNCKLGESNYFITEADESDGSFLFMEPEFLLITNIEQDHMEFFQSEEKLYFIFARLIDRVKAAGKIFLNGDDPGVRRMMEEANFKNRQVITYGKGKINDLHYRLVRNNYSGFTARVFRRGELLGVLELTVPGEHNVLNALAAVGVGLELGIPFSLVVESLKQFKGVNRRFHIQASRYGITIVDDYGHHPTEIKATLRAARARGAASIITVFQPHRYTRTRFLFDEFLEAFEDSDEVIVTKIYSAGEKPIPGVSARRLAEALHHERVIYIESFDEIENYLWARVKPGDMIITLGAGDIWKVGKRMAGKLMVKPLTVGLEV